MVPLSMKRQSKQRLKGVSGREAAGVRVEFSSGCGQKLRGRAKTEFGRGSEIILAIKAR